MSAPKGLTTSDIPELQQPTLAYNPKSEEDRPPQVELQDRSNAGDVLDLDRRTLDRNYTYRWVYKSPTKVGRTRARGYEIVNPQKEPGIRTTAGDAPGIAPDGTYTTRDVVLMRVKRVVYGKRRTEIKGRTDERLKGQVKKFKNTARSESRKARLETPVEVITTKGGF